MDLTYTYVGTLYILLCGLLNVINIHILVGICVLAVTGSIHVCQTAVLWAPNNTSIVASVVDFGVCII